MKKLLSKNRASWWDQVAALFDNTYNEVEKELAKIYYYEVSQIVKDMQLVYQEILLGQNKSVNALYQFNRYYDLINEINGHLRAIGAQEVQITNNALKSLYEANLKLIGDTYGFTPIINGEKVLRAANSIWCQDGKLWSDRVWQDKQLLVNELSKAMVDGVARGISVDNLTKQVMKVMNTGYNETQRIIVTELAHVQNQAALDGYKQAGLTKYKILHEPDACEVCVELGKNTYDVNKAPVIPAHPRCRCCCLGIIEGVTEIVRD